MLLYAQDATLIRSEKTTIGSAAIRAEWKSVMDEGSVQFVMSPLPPIEKSDLGYEIGSYQENVVTKDKKELQIKGEFIIIGEKVDKKWIIAVQNFTAQQPSVVAPALGMFAENFYNR
jgi:hypothetical protein